MAAVSIRAGMVRRIDGEQICHPTASLPKETGPQYAKLSSLSQSRKGGSGLLLSSAHGQHRHPCVVNSGGFRALSGDVESAVRDDVQAKDLVVGETGIFLAGNANSTRRGIIGAGIALAAASTISFPALAAQDDYRLYEDGVNKFSILVPQQWLQGEGNVGQRKVTAFYPDSESASANVAHDPALRELIFQLTSLVDLVGPVNVVITDLGADYTALGSFGSVDAFAENLVNSMDRAWKKPKGQAAKLIDARAKNGMYYIEYTVQKPAEEKRHLLSVLGIASNGWVNRLYTVTGQFWESDDQKYKASLQKAISSFRLV